MAAGLGIGTIFVGYSLAYYGITQIQGGRWGLLDLVVPGRWTSAKSKLRRDNGT